MLRFDPSGAVRPEFGVTPGQLKSLYPRLLELRRDLLDDDLTRDDWRFYSLPKEQLDAYSQYREASELGRIFKVANSQMSIVDAVVVLGSGASNLVPRALLEASCDPYHNELRRGPRGGKPRFYFAGDHLDNDETRALLSRIAAGGYDETEEEEKWAIVVIDKSGETQETSVALRQFSRLLSENLAGDDSKLLTRLIVPITGSKGSLRELATALNCEEIFSIPEDLDDRFQALSPVGLIPAAMIGLDIMKLLEGAVAMNEHFAVTPPDKNVVLQFVAINHLLQSDFSAGSDHFMVWNRALATLGSWYNQLRDRPSPPLTASGLTHHLIVENCRTDPLPVGMSEFNQDLLNEIANKTLLDLVEVTVQTKNATLLAAKRPATKIILPTIDTFVLGQLFQMLMISTAIANRLSTSVCTEGSN